MTTPQPVHFIAHLTVKDRGLYRDYVKGFFPLLAEHGVRVLGREGLAGATVGEHHASLEHARAHADERDAVAVRGVHVGLHLEHETRHRRIERAFRAFDIDTRWR